MFHSLEDELVDDPEGLEDDDELDDPGGLEDWERELEEEEERKRLRRMVESREQGTRDNKGKGDTCPHCFMTFKDLQNHIASQHVQEFECADCGFVCSSKQDLVNHISDVHNKQTETICPICGLQFDNVKHHMAQVHDANQATKVPGEQVSVKKKKGKKEIGNAKKTDKMSKCPHCFREFTNLKHHINQQHSQLKNYKCGDCGYSCYLKTDLERHITNVHDKCRTPCPICGKKYSDLRQHIRLVHEGHKLECPECGKKYTNLSQHLNKMHRKKKILMCDKCGKTFYLQSQLKTHQKDVHSF